MRKPVNWKQLAEDKHDDVYIWKTKGLYALIDENQEKVVQLESRTKTKNSIEEIYELKMEIYNDEIATKRLDERIWIGVSEDEVWLKLTKRTIAKTQAEDREKIEEWRREQLRSLQ